VTTLQKEPNLKTDPVRFFFSGDIPVDISVDKFEEKSYPLAFQQLVPTFIPDKILKTDVLLRLYKLILLSTKPVLWVNPLWVTF
jgi:hypothetical protein